MSRLRKSDLERLRCRQCRAPLIAISDQDEIIDLDKDNIGYCYDCWSKLRNMNSDEILTFVQQRFKDSP